MPNFDITKPLPFTPNTVDDLFLEHVIEHISPAEAIQFFIEARRILKPGGILRLAFPDLLRIARETTPEYVEFVENAGWGDGTPGSEIRSIIVNHGHKAIWTAETMIVALESVGFTAGQSPVPHMQSLEPHIRKEMSLAARAWGEELGGLQASIDSREEVFDSIDKRPE